MKSLSMNKLGLLIIASNFEKIMSRTLDISAKLNFDLGKNVWHLPHNQQWGRQRHKYKIEFI